MSSSARARTRSTVDGVELRRGSRVRLRPRAGGDVFDLALAGRTAVVEAIEQDWRAASHSRSTSRTTRAATSAARASPATGSSSRPRRWSRSAATAPRAGPRILVAGIGNIFLADDGFGVALAERLAAARAAAGVEVVDFGIRGMDLAYALGDGWDAVVLLDAAPRGERAGHAVRHRAATSTTTERRRSTPTGWTP